MEAKNSPPKNFQNAPNRGFNPQYRKPPLQILQRGQKEQKDQVPHPLYLEGQVEASPEDSAYEQEEACPVFSDNDDIECPVQESEEGELQANSEIRNNKDTEEHEIDDYCKQFVDFMQAQFNRRYDLRSSRKRTRTQDEEEDTPQKSASAQKEVNTQKPPEKGKRPLNQSLQSDIQMPSSSQVAVSPDNKPTVKEVKPPPQSKE